MPTAFAPPWPLQTLLESAARLATASAAAAAAAAQALAAPPADEWELAADSLLSPPQSSSSQQPSDAPLDRNTPRPSGSATPSGGGGGGGGGVGGGASSGALLGAGDFRNVPIFPTTEEILGGGPPALKPNIVDGLYDSVLEYLDTHFRLLREDCLAPLRQGVRGSPSPQTRYRV